MILTILTLLKKKKRPVVADYLCIISYAVHGLKEALNHFTNLKFTIKKELGRRGEEKESTLQDPTQYMQLIDFRNLHLLPVPLSRSNNVPQNMGDG